MTMMMMEKCEHETETETARVEMRGREKRLQQKAVTVSSATMRQCRNNPFLNAQLLPLSHFIIQYYAHT